MFCTAPEFSFIVVQVLDLVPPESVAQIIRGEGVIPTSSEVLRAELHEILELPQNCISMFLRRFTSRLDLRDCCMPPQGFQTLMHALPSNTQLTTLHVSFRDYEEGDSDKVVTMLGYLQRALAHMPAVTVLGLHHVHSDLLHGDENVEFLGAIAGCLMSVKRQLRGLALCDWDFQDRNASDPDSEAEERKRLLLCAVSRLVGLKTIYVPELQGLYGNNAALLAPLQRLPHVVAMVEERESYSPGRHTQSQPLQLSNIAPARALLPGWEFQAARKRLLRMSR